MKVAQNDETNPDTQPVRPPHTPNIPGVARRIPGRRHAPLSICIPVCASLLKANLFNLCLYSDIVASADSSMIKHLYSSPRGLGLYYDACMTYLCFRVVL